MRIQSAWLVVTWIVSLASLSAYQAGAQTETPVNSKVLRGLYGGFQLTREVIVGANVAPLYREGTARRWITFYADGQVCQTSPAEGPDVYNPQSCPTHGRYRVVGNTVEITWSTGEKVSSLRAPNGTLTFYGVDYRPLPTCDGLKLEGAYGRLWDNEYLERRVIHFTREGTFTDEGILTQTGLPSADKYLDTPPTWSNENPPRGSGTYRIIHNTLYLHYRNRPKETVQIYVLPQDVNKKSVPKIFLGGFTFERKEAPSQR